jgi:hypothetical protein
MLLRWTKGLVQEGSQMRSFTRRQFALTTLVIGVAPLSNLRDLVFIQDLD